MNLLCLLGGSDLSGTNSPDWLVGNDHLAPLLSGDLLGDSGKLVSDDLNGLTLLALLEGLSAAEDDVDVLVKSSLGLGSDELVGLANDGAALGVTNQGPVDVGVLELVGGDLAGKSSLVLVVDVLGGDSDLWLGLRAGKSQVKCWWGNDNLCCVSVVFFFEVLISIPKTSAHETRMAANRKLARYESFRNRVEKPVAGFVSFLHL